MTRRKRTPRNKAPQKRERGGANHRASRVAPPRPEKLAVSVLAREVGGEVIGDRDVEVSGIGSLPEAGPGMISFAVSPKYFPRLAASRASAFLVPEKAAGLRRPQIVVPNTMLAVARIIEIFHPEREEPEGISPEAWIAPTARLGKGVVVYPFVYIGPEAEIGDATVIYPHCYVGPGVKIGKQCRIFSRVSFRQGTSIGNRVIIHDGVVIGGDGFGYVWDGERHRKIPQVGGVEIEDDVEIGANTAIDRATLEKTVIRRGTKIDNLVQIAHNVSIGSHGAIAAQVGIAGSSRIGEQVLIGGQAGIDDHVQVGDRVMIAGQAGVAKDLPDGVKVGGTPTVPFLTWLRVSRVLPDLPEIQREIEALKRGFASLSAEGRQKKEKKRERGRRGGGS